MYSKGLLTIACTFLAFTLSDAAFHRVPKRQVQIGNVIDQRLPSQSQGAAGGAPIVNQATSTKSFGGANNYFIHGAPDPEISTWVNTLKTSGAKLVRLWVTGTQGGCTKGTKTEYIYDLESSTIGTYNDTVLAKLDKVLNLLAQAQIKAIISPHDSGKLRALPTSTSVNGVDAYTPIYTSEDFYTTDAAFTYYSNRLNHILKYVSPSTNKPWGQWGDAIAAFDLQNEPYLFFDQTGLLPSGNTDWICKTAKVLKDGLTGPNPPKVASGSLGGSCGKGQNFNAALTGCQYVDIISIHGFGSVEFGDPANVDCDAATIAQKAKAVNKLAIVEEMGLNDKDGFVAQTTKYNDGGIPWLYWQIITGNERGQTPCSTECCGETDGYDGYEFSIITDEAKSTLAGWLQAAATSAAQQDWSKVVNL